MSTAKARFRFGQIADVERFLDRLEVHAIRHTVTTTSRGATVEIDALPLKNVIMARDIRKHLYKADPLLDVGENAR